MEAEIVDLIHKDRRREIELIADLSAIYTMLPRSVLEALGIRPTERRFKFAGGEVREYPTGEVYIEVSVGSDV